MQVLNTAKYVKELPTQKSPHPELTVPKPFASADENFGNMGFTTYWECINKAFTMNPNPHQHPFPQYLTFLGGDITNMTDLGGIIELTLGEDLKHLEVHTITKATMVYIAPGLYHCPIVYKKITKPILFNDLFFGAKYSRDMST